MSYDGGLCYFSSKNASLFNSISASGQSYKASTIIEGLKRPQMTLFRIAFYSMVAESSPEKVDPCYEEILSLPIANLIGVHQPFDYDSKVIQSKNCIKSDS